MSVTIQFKKLVYFPCFVSLACSAPSLLRLGLALEADVAILFIHHCGRASIRGVSRSRWQEREGLLVQEIKPWLGDPSWLWSWRSSTEELNDSLAMIRELMLTAGPASVLGHAWKSFLASASSLTEWVMSARQLPWEPSQTVGSTSQKSFHKLSEASQPPCSAGDKRDVLSRGPFSAPFLCTRWTGPALSPRPCEGFSRFVLCVTSSHPTRFP